MKYSEFATIDNYSMKLMGKRFSKIRSSTRGKELAEALSFMSSFEKSDKYTQASLRLGSEQALKVLHAFEKECNDIQAEEDADRKKNDHKNSHFKYSPFLIL